MLRRMRSYLLVAAGLLAAGCFGDADRNASIEAMNKGSAFAEQQQWTSAVKEYQNATTLDATNHRAWYNLGQVLGKQKKWRDAMDAYQEAIKHQDTDAMYHYKLGQAIYESWAEESGGSLDQAQTHLEKAVKLNPRLFKAHWYLGRVYDRKDDPARAAQAYTESAKLAPFFGLTFISLGKLYFEWDFIDQAITVLEQGTVCDRDPNCHMDPTELTDVYYHLGLAYDAQQNWDKAIEAYTAALDKQKGNLDARRQRGFSYARKGDKAKARADLEDFVKSKGTTPGQAPGLDVQAANDLLMRMMASN